MGEHESETLRVRVPAAVAEALAAHCQQTGLTTSDAIREALRKYLRLPADAAEVKAGRPWHKER